MQNVHRRFLRQQWSNNNRAACSYGRLLRTPPKVTLQFEAAEPLKILLIVMVIATLGVADTGAAGTTVAFIGLLERDWLNPAEPPIVLSVAVVAVSRLPPVGATCPDEREKLKDSKSDVPFVLPGTFLGRNTKRAKSPTCMFTALQVVTLLTALMNRSPCQRMKAAFAGVAATQPKTAIPTNACFMGSPPFIADGCKLPTKHG